jgi:DNA-binding NarL/FixJ family response regulator
VTNGGPTAGDTAAGILICDDNDALRLLLRAVIDTGLDMHVVGEAADGNEVIAEAARLQPDVILLDLAMPNLSGLDALPEVHRIAPNAQIIVFSGFDSAAVAEEVIALGAASYLEKGASPETIVATIADAHAKPRGAAA